MKKNFIKYLSLLPATTIVGPFFALSSCNNHHINPEPLKDPYMTIDEEKTVTFLYDEKINHSFEVHLDNFVGNEITYFSIKNQKKDGIDGQYVQFTDFDENPFVFIQNICEGQTSITLSTQLITDYINPSFEGTITFDLNVVVLRSGINILNTNLSSFTFYLAHATPSDVFLREYGEEGEVKLLGLDFKNHLEEIQKSTLLLIPDDITKISDNAFFLNNETTIPQNIRWLDFETNIRSFPILLYIGDNAFRKAHFEDTILLPETVQHIGSFAFDECTKISGDIILPKWLDYMGQYAFSNCQKITSISFGGDMLKQIGDCVFSGCTALKTINKFSSDMSVIGAKAFYECVNLESDLIIPSKVTQIGDFAFYGCKKLKKLKFESFDSSFLQTIGAHAFEKSGLSGMLTLPNNLVTIKDYAFYNCQLESSFTFPEELLNIGDYAFANCYLGNKIVFNSKISHIGKEAFVNNNLHLIDLWNQKQWPKKVPKWLEDIKSDPFTGCAKIGCIVCQDIGWFNYFKETFPSLNNWSYSSN